MSSKAKDTWDYQLFPPHLCVYYLTKLYFKFKK